ncbi:MAG: hypothetical protein A2992_09435 [Elusimicrobia bacterium RIFCSPLOWO2_01_FULL_59_12]|nr:MAG: hypothetical protein A2992_09435 [Elusimicrobia bacterium RIFCSPLOWO2_01_FULL_59_12]
MSSEIPAPPSLEDIQKRKDPVIVSIVREYTPILFKAALGMGFREADAEELVQDTFVAFYSGAERFEGRSKIKTFLFSILYHKASRARSSRVREEAADIYDQMFESRFTGGGMWSAPPKGPEDEALGKELQEWIDRCSEQLAIKEKTAFHLRELEDLSSQEICKILDISGTNLGVILFRARNKLRDCLEKKWRSKP